MLVGVMALVPVTRAVDRVVTNDAATGAGSLTAAINALNDGDRITFHIPPEAGEVHYIQVPPDGFPLITKNNITIDGYTQGGATSNTASIHAANNAVLKIVLTGTNGNGLSMYLCGHKFCGVRLPQPWFWRWRISHPGLLPIHQRLDQRPVYSICAPYREQPVPPILLTTTPRRSALLPMVYVRRMQNDKC